jgi:hypothetical protein
MNSSDTERYLREKVYPVLMPALEDVLNNVPSTALMDVKDGTDISCFQRGSSRMSSRKIESFDPVLHLAQYLLKNKSTAAVSNE